MDLTPVFKGYNLALYLGLALSICTLFYALLLKTRGDQRSFWYFVSSFVALVLIASANSILNVIYNGNNALYFALVGLAFVSAVYYFSIGQFRRGIWHLIGACAISLALILIPVVCQWFGVNPSNVLGNVTPVIVSVSPNKNPIDVNEPVEIKVEITNGVPFTTYTVTIDFGDGTSNGGSITTGSDGKGSTIFTHAYSAEGGYSIVASVNGSGWGVGHGTVVVKHIGWIGGLWSVVNWFAGKLGDALGWIIRAPFEMILLNPIVDVTNTNTLEGKLYNVVLTATIGFFALFLAFRITHAVLTNESVDAAILSSVKEGALAVLLIAIGPWVYNVTAQFTNAVAYQLLYIIDPGQIFAMFFVTVVGLLVGGLISPGIGVLAAILVIIPLIAYVIGWFKWMLIKTFVIAIPLLTIGYLHPALRNVIKHIVGVWGTIMLCGPLAGILLALITEALRGSGPFGAIVYFLCIPIIYLLLPKLAHVVMGNYAEAATHTLSNALFAGLAVGSAVSFGGNVANVGLNSGLSTFSKGGDRTTFNLPVGFEASTGSKGSIYLPEGWGVPIWKRLPSADPESLGLPEKDGRTAIEKLGIQTDLTSIGSATKRRIAQGFIERAKENVFARGMKERDIYEDSEGPNIINLASSSDSRETAFSFDVNSEKLPRAYQKYRALDFVQVAKGGCTSVTSPPIISRVGAKLANVMDKGAYNVKQMFKNVTRPDVLAAAHYLSTGRYVPYYPYRIALERPAEVSREEDLDIFAKSIVDDQEHENAFGLTEDASAGEKF